MYPYGPPHMAEQKQDDLLEYTFSSYVRIRDVSLKTCQSWWTIGKSGERKSGISVLEAWYDDDEISTIVGFKSLGFQPATDGAKPCSPSSSFQNFLFTFWLWKEYFSCRWNSLIFSVFEVLVSFSLHSRFPSETHASPNLSPTLR